MQADQQRAISCMLCTAHKPHKSHDWAYAPLRFGWPCPGMWNAAMEPLAVRWLAVATSVICLVPLQVPLLGGSARRADALMWA